MCAGGQRDILERSANGGRSAGAVMRSGVVSAT